MNVMDGNNHHISLNFQSMSAHAYEKTFENHYVLIYMYCTQLNEGK